MFTWVARILDRRVKYGETIKVVAGAVTAEDIFILKKLFTVGSFKLVGRMEFTPVNNIKCLLCF